jgi:hypothetical protein
MKGTLSLKPQADVEHVHVREAKGIAAEIGYPGDTHMIAYALALIEAKDEWQNKPRR